MTAIIWITILGIAACSEIPEKNLIYLSGRVELTSDAMDGRSAFVTILKRPSSESMNNMADISGDTVVDLLEVSKSNYSFTIELSEKGFVAGDTIALFAFTDKNYSQGIPFPNQGDIIGMYYDDTEGMPSTAYTLKNGLNEDLLIKINREIFSFDAKVTGTIAGHDAGNLTLIAYAGDITSSDLSKLDFDTIIGYRTMTKDPHPLHFQMDIWPYGFDIPAGNTRIFVFALLDVNRNDVIDMDDKIGYFSVNENDEDLPARILLHEGTNPLTSDMHFSMDVPDTSAMGDTSLSGLITLPPAYNPDAPLFIIVADAAADTSVSGSDMEKMFSSIKYFEKVPQDSASFTIDLSSTGLNPGDDISIYTLLDNDFDGYPDLSEGDVVGIYVSKETLSGAYSLQDRINDGIEINTTRDVFSFDATISGSVAGSERGDLTLAAYAGEITSSDFSKLDLDAIIGYHTLPKGDTDISFEMDVLPYGFNIFEEDVYAYMLAVLDINQNEKIDAGDKIGYYSDEDNMPVRTKIDKPATFLDSDIQLTMAVEAPSDVDVEMTGLIVLPSGYDAGSKPIYLLITDADDMDNLLSDPVSTVKYFERVPPGSFLFNIDLSKIGFRPGDRAMVLALWDNDYEYGFPQPTAGDHMGFGQNRKSVLTAVTLSEGLNRIMPTTGWELRLNKIWYEHAASLEFTLDDGGLPLLLDDNGDGSKLDPGDRIILVAIHKNGVNDEWSDLTPPNFSITDMDYIIGMNTHTVTANPSERYRVDIFPMINENILVRENPFRIEDVYVFAVLDDNANGLLDQGEYIGYYWRLGVIFYLPEKIDIRENQAYFGESIRFTNQKF